MGAAIGHWGRPKDDYGTLKRKGPYPRAGELEEASDWACFLKMKAI